MLASGVSGSHLLKVGTVLEKLGVRVGVGGVLITRKEVEGGGRVSEGRWFMDERRVLRVVVLVLGCV